MMKGRTAPRGGYLRRSRVLNGVDDGRADHRAISTVLSQIEDMLALGDTEANSHRNIGVLADACNELRQV
jgi:hypothetical protein